MRKIFSFLLMGILVLGIVSGCGLQKKEKTEVVNEEAETDDFKEFDDNCLGVYTYEDEKGNISHITLNKENGQYTYVLNYYPVDSIKPSEELMGTWDTTKDSFSLNDTNPASIGKYDISNLKYYDGGMSFDIRATAVVDLKYQSNLIPDGNYVYFQDW